MKILCDELSRLFPEFFSTVYDGDKELPYMMMVNLASWLKEIPAPLNPVLVGNIVKFARWCESQPRGTGAENDMLTIFAVGFLEELFDSDATQALLPVLMSKEELHENSDYLKRWVGAENYEMASRRLGKI